MHDARSSPRWAMQVLRAGFVLCSAFGLALGLAGCGGGDAPAGPPPVAAPTITAAPTPQSVVAGQPAVFEVAASGAALQYQWRRNDVDIADAVAARYTLQAAQASDHGHAFSVTVRNAGGSITSAVARLSVLAIEASPQPAVVTAGEPATFSVVTTGDGTSLQWQRNGVDVAGATQAQLTLATTTLADDQSQWTVTARNAAGSVVSSPVRLGVKPASGSLELVVGDIGGPGNLDGAGAAARFRYIGTMAQDAAGALWVGDDEGRLLRRIGPDGQVTTLVGASVTPALVDGPAAAARFVYITQLAWSPGPPAAALYVIDDGRLRRVDADGRVTTLTSAEAGYQDGPLATARFRKLGALAAHPDGSLYVSEQEDCAVRKIDLQAGQVSTLARSPTCAVDWSAPPDLWGITAMAVDGQGRVNALRPGALLRIDAAGQLSAAASLSFPSPYTSAGRRLAVDAAGRVHFFVQSTTWPTGSFLTVLEDGSIGPTTTYADSATESSPFVVTASGRIVHADGEHVSLRVAGGGQPATILAGAPVDHLRATTRPVAVEGGGSLLRLIKPWGRFGALQRTTQGGALGVIELQQEYLGEPYEVREVISDGQGGVYTLWTQGGFCITGYCYPEPGRIDHIAASGQVQLVAGSSRPGESDGTGAEAEFLSPHALTLGPNGDLFVITPGRIRRVTPAGVVSTFASGLPAGDALTADKSGHLYLASHSGPQILKFTPLGQASVFHDLTTANNDEARQLGVWGLAVAANGDVLAARCLANVVDRITPAGMATAVVGTPGLSGIRTGSLPGALDCPRGLSWDTSGALYIRTDNALLKARFNP